MKRLVSLFLLIAISHSGISQNVDIAILREINLHRNRSLDEPFKVITNSVTPLEIATPAVFGSLYLIKKDSSVIRKTVFICTSFIISSAITLSLKYIIKRDRPFITYPYLEQRTPADSPSFPSGHTSSAFSLATSLSILYPKWYVITPSFLWASSVGYSRMHLGVHYPSDVLAGALIGAGSTWLAYKLNKWIFSFNE